MRVFHSLCHKYNYNFQENESIAFCELGAWFKYLYNGWKFVNVP
jgi:hypothetical protein